jgi:hypothetical protein
MPLLPWLLTTLRRAAWAPILVFGLHVASSSLGLYGVWPPLDIPMHFLGGMAIAWFFGHAYLAAEELDLLGRPAAILYRVTVFALTGSTTVFWELVEFLSDRYAGTHAQKGLEDTLGDMLVGILGGLAVAVLFAPRGRKARRTPESHSPSTG